MATRNTTFLLKRSSVAGKVPTAGSLLLGEIALNTADAILYTSGTTANTILPIGWDRVARTGDTMTGTLYAPTVSATTIYSPTVSATTISAVTLSFNTTYTGSTPYGTISWNTDFGLPQVGLIGGNVVQKIGESVYAYVKNVDSSTLNKGEVVYIFGASGDKIAVKRASNTGDTTSSKTLGVVAESIAVNGLGYVITQGTLDGLNLGSYTAGDILWLDSTPGQFTVTKQYSPNHLVFIGVVQRANAGNGQLYVKPQNGYELEEIHDVMVTGATFGDLLTYSAYNGSNVWVNSKTLNGSYTITGNTTVGGSLSASTLISTQSSGDEGGDLKLATAATNNTLSGGTITVDIYQNRFRIFESGGSNRGVYIDLTAASTGVGTNLLSGGGGEINTASNLGSGTGLFAQKVAADLQFKSLTSTGGTVTISNTSNTVNLEVVPASNFTGGTVTGATRFTNGLTANTISATTYVNLPFSGTVTGNGTANYLPKWTGTTALGNSLLQDDGSTIGLNITPQAASKFTINGGSLTGLQASSIGIGIIGEGGSGAGVQGQVYQDGPGTYIGVKGMANPADTPDITTVYIGGSFSGFNGYSVQLQDGTEGVGKFLYSVTSDGKAHWTNDISGSTFTITSTPTNNDSNTQVLTRNSTTGVVQYTNSSALGGGSFNYGLAVAISSGNYLI